MSVKPVPEGYHSVTPYLLVADVAQLLDFVKQAFDAEEIHRMPRSDGRVGHAEVRIGDSRVMMGEPMDRPASPSMLYLYHGDCDGVYRRALAAGATSISEPANQFYGDRSAAVKDPCGNSWWIATHVEDVSPEELARRAAAKK